MILGLDDSFREEIKNDALMRPNEGLRIEGTDSEGLGTKDSEVA